MAMDRKKFLKVLVLGAILAGLFWVAKGPPAAEANLPEIAITEADVAHQAARYEQTWRRPPTAEELNKAIDGYVRNEILYREALARGMDREDPRVRIALIQKMEMLAVGRADAQEITDEDLNAFYSLRKERYRVPATLSLTHVLFKDGTNAQEKVASLLAQYREKDPSEEELTAAGDSTLLERVLTSVDADEIERQFGTDFTAEVLSLPADTWSGPVRSGYGLHIVRVYDRVAGRIPELEEVRDKVERDLKYEAAEAAEEQSFQEISGKYKVTVTDGAKAMMGEGRGAGSSEQ